MLLCATTAITADLTTALDAWWRFDEPGVATVADQSGSESSHDGTLNGKAIVSALGLCGGAGDFSNGEMNVSNHADINLGINTQRTIALWFMADDVDAPGRQMLYEEGGGTRGLNIYIEDGELVVGGWNRAESGWQGTWLRTSAVEEGQWHHVVLTLDGGATTQPDALRAYLDGSLYGSGEGSQLWSHSGDVTIGGVGDTLFPDGGSGAAAFQGLIDDSRLYNRALSSHDVAVLSGQFNEGAAITLATQWRDDLLAFYDLPEVIGMVLESDTAQSTASADAQTQTATQGEPARAAAYAAPGADKSPDAPPQDAPPPTAPASTTATDSLADNIDSAGHETNVSPVAVDSDAEGDTETEEDTTPRVTEVPTEGKGTRDKRDTPEQSEPEPSVAGARDD